MKKSRAGLFLAAATIAAMSVMADVDWKWDTSGHVETPPATDSVDISSMMPFTAGHTTDEGYLNLFSYLWADSNPFHLSGVAPGLFLIVQ